MDHSQHTTGTELTGIQQVAGQKRDAAGITTVIPEECRHIGDEHELGGGGEAKRPKLSEEQMNSHHRNDNNTTSLEETGMEGRQCFVTVGATAGFRPLLSEVIKPEFLDCLADNNFTLLTVQCGEDLEWFDAQVKTLRPPRSNVRVECFAFTENMTEHYVRSRGEKSVRMPGVVVAHAGETVSF